MYRFYRENTEIYCNKRRCKIRQYTKKRRLVDAAKKLQKKCAKNSQRETERE
jgi:hypothetical protein